MQDTLVDTLNGNQQLIKDVQNVEQSIDYSNPYSIAIYMTLIGVLIYFAVKTYNKPKNNE